MIQQALDFRTESDYLNRILQPINPSYFKSPTQFKQWTIDTVLQHLHYGNIAADLSLRNQNAFDSLLNDIQRAKIEGKSMVEHTRETLGNPTGTSLLRTWHEFCSEMAGYFHSSDPKIRVKWFGPEMSVLSSITARLMETWSHSQSIYDMLGHNRENYDYIKNIVILGNNTFQWTFTNREEPVPAAKPFLQLSGPSGIQWKFNEDSETERIKGPAIDFCQVVTQTRNVKDTKLEINGQTATRWMNIAQCFAGPPSDPPLAGARFTQKKLGL